MESKSTEPALTCSGCGNAMSIAMKPPIDKPPSTQRSI
jgi:hypothetical protein